MSLTAGRDSPVGYLMSAFPVATETFILFEILELERQGAVVEIFPLRPTGQPVPHPEAATLARRSHYARLWSLGTLLSQLSWIVQHPGRYLSVWRRCLSGTVRSPRHLARALVVVPLAARFARQMQRLGVEHVHAHWATHPALAAYVIHHLTGLSYSFTAHAHDIYIERAMLGEKIRHASFVVTISDFNRRFLADLYGPAAALKTSVIRCGVEVSAFDSRGKERPVGPFTVACVAGLREKKGHRYLIEAIADLRSKGLEVRCVLVGDGPERTPLEDHVRRLGVHDLVVFKGQRSRRDVSEILRSSDAMVLPSVTTADGDMEGIPVALMEALAAAVPVVASSLSGIPELVEHERTGLLVAERRPDEIAAAIRRIHDDPEGAAAMAAEGRARVLDAYDLQGNATRLRQLLQWEYLPVGERTRPE